MEALIFRRVEEHGDRAFDKLQRGDGFEAISWRDFGARVREAILGVHALGLERGDPAAILSENCLEWRCADTATLAGGLPNVAVSPRLSEVMVAKILSHARCRAAFVENETALRSRVERINAALEHDERVREIAVTKDGFPPDVRTVTAFRKIKIDRPAVERTYRKEIGRIYGSAAGRGAA